MSDKYFRTPHLPYSPCVALEDKRIKCDGHLNNENIIITEKVDGSNVCLTVDNVFGRSHGHAPKHPSFAPLKAFHSQVQYQLQPDMSYFGEWVYAKHSIAYTALPSYFLLFAVREDNSGIWLSWDSVEEIANIFNFNTVPILWKGKTQNLQKLIGDIIKSNPFGKCGAVPEIEGVVVRKNKWSDNIENIAKWVRPNHVQTDIHWKNQKVVPNSLA